ncbi:hypothetical protein [Halorhodospira halochloris]|nr:hypothetical protein [Halorhodospira halochloris]
MPTWEALHAWLAPRDPTGVYRLMLDLMLLLGLREREVASRVPNVRYRVTVDGDPRTPWEGLVSGVVWLWAWLQDAPPR